MSPLDKESIFICVAGSTRSVLPTIYLWLFKSVSSEMPRNATLKRNQEIEVQGSQVLNDVVWDNPSRINIYSLSLLH